MSSSVEEIKSKIDIVSLVSSYMSLEKTGGNFKGKCPFHNEKTPSFFVSPDRGSYYCFGCHAKGDIFTFVQEFEGLDFVGALKMLADRAGVTLDRFSRENKTGKDRLYAALEQAVFFYQKMLSAHPSAEEYLRGRGVTDATIRHFRLGYAPAEWRSLFDFLKSKGVSEGDMLAAGLIKRPEGRTDAYYDTFRGRIMFPIADSAGRVVGFSGRIVVADDSAPKYLNSPETEIFNKSEVLFGLDKAKKDIRLKDYSILVEGQMDLVMMHQAGITNTIASSGTALTSEHLIKLRRLSDRIIMAYDGDDAGFAAADRSARLALSLGMELKVAEMPRGKDPADMVRENVADLAERLARSKHIIDFYVDSLLGRGLSSRDLGREIREHVLPYVAILPSSIDRANFISSIARKTFIKEEALWDDLKRTTVSAPASEPVVPRFGFHQSLERRIMGIIWWQESMPQPSINAKEYAERVAKIVGDRFAEMEQSLKNEKDALLFETEAYYNTTTDISIEIQELLLRLEEEYLKKEFSETMIKLQQAEQVRNSADVLKYLEMCQHISNQINIIKSIHTHNEKK